MANKSETIRLAHIVHKATGQKCWNWSIRKLKEELEIIRKMGKRYASS